MATHYYYKEVQDPDDESVKTPVAVDNLFAQKANLSDNANVPKEKEVGFGEGQRDLSNLFQRKDTLESDTLFVPASLGEPSYFYVDGKDLSEVFVLNTKDTPLTDQDKLNQAKVPYKETIKFSNTIPSSSSVVPGSSLRSYVFNSKWFNGFEGVFNLYWMHPDGNWRLESRAGWPKTVSVVGNSNTVRVAWGVDSNVASRIQLIEINRFL